MTLNERWQRWLRRSYGPRRQMQTPTRLSLEGLEERTLLSNFTAANVTELIGDIAAANNAGGNNTITLAGNTTFTLSQANNTTKGDNGLPVISSGDNLTILGNGDTITRSSSTAFRLLFVASGASLTLENLTLSGGLATGSLAEGGAIFNQGNLTLQGVTVQDNTAQGINGANGSAGTNAIGGGIYSLGGSVALNGGTLLESNKALGGNGGNGAAGPNTGGAGGSGDGGGLYIDGGNVTLTDVTLSGNTAQGGNGGNGGSGGQSNPGDPGGLAGLGVGGGLYVAAGSKVILTEDTVTNNVAHGGNGGIGGFGSPSQTSGGGGDGAGGGVYITNGSATLSRDLLAGNMAEGGDGGTGSSGVRDRITSVTFVKTAGTGGSGGNGSGGGLFVSSGSVTLTEDALINNAAHGGNGGNGGNGQDVTGTGNNGGNGGNGGAGAGGGLYIVGSNAILTDDTLADNGTQGGNGGNGGKNGRSGNHPGNSGMGNFSFGGGIVLDGAGNATLTDTSLVGNTTQQNGGGIDDASTGTVALLDDTLTANSANNGGGVFTSETTGLTLQNTLVAGNSAGIAGPDVDFGNLTVTGVDQGGNLIGISGQGSGNSGFTAATTQTGTVAAPLQPLLGPLQYNGGPLVGALSQQVGLQTEALLPGSPAIGKGVTNNVTTDERGFNRTSPPDIGAFQFQDAAFTVAIAPATPSVTVNGSETFTLTVTNTSGNALPADNATLTITLSSGLTTTGPLTFPLAALAVGQSQTFTVTATATTSGTQTLTASLTSPDSNPNTVNGSAAVTVLANTPPPATHTPVGGLTLFGFGFGPTGLDLFEVDGKGDVFAQGFSFAGVTGAPLFLAADTVFTNLALQNNAIVADLIGGNGQMFLMEVLNFTDPFVFQGLLNALFGK